MRSLSLRTLKLRPGEQHRDEIELELEPFELGGQRYLPVPEKVPADLTISRASTGTVFELRSASGSTDRATAASTTRRSTCRSPRATIRRRTPATPRS